MDQATEPIESNPLIPILWTTIARLAKEKVGLIADTNGMEHFSARLLAVLGIVRSVFYTIRTGTWSVCFLTCHF